ncbi:M28 family peptidase [Maribacter algarum]|uniref:Vacuolar membrane protease n=1 Tax=Maribacter algarum (ex Zhang et al. 2020) TaxID=2578118 RepID=A0A5S3PWF5_9FLAO|nr:M28 family peptidase [Maribacter algarum]TMM58552.1 M28 family peptidase [Maribacter algarum]
MKRSSAIFTLLLIVFAIYWSFRSLTPVYSSDSSAEKTSFSTDRALEHVKQIARKPHGVGFPAHKEVREYIVSELEKMGLETSIQEGYTSGDWGNLSKAINILARIKGSDSGKALMLLSHYDSSTHSSFGASDAGSGVATILEGIRAYLANNPNPKNDIIILISDSEELGLNGADLFVKEHPWKKDIGLVLNFEARGSGGPSYMLIETNRGNANLIKEFTEANPKYPVANSLAYSIYKMLPNDTDLTVFREDGDIEGFNFAFIDDHFDYHTAKDTYERLDKKTMAHQGSYLMPLLDHFSQADLTNLKSLNDSIYFNVPFFKLISYPFEWIWPMFGLAVLCFILLLLYGFRRKALNPTEVGKGFLPMLLAIAINGAVGYFCWTVLKWMYPAYKDILHGFTYNGHTYILAFVLFSIAVCFWVYNRFKKVETANLLVAPILLWLVICGLVSHYLSGASFFIIPVFAVLSAFMVLLNQKMPNPYLLTFLALPALFIYAPFVKMFPVGLGLKMMVAATLFTTLTFLLLLPIFGFYKKKRRLAYLGLILFFGCMISAHFNSRFDKDSPKPTSLLYVLDADSNKAKWATYENTLSDWTAQYIGTEKKSPEKLSKKTISSKYSSGFTYVSEAPTKEIPQMLVEKTRDTVIGNSRLLDICITPNRNVNRLEVFTETPLESAIVNTIKLSDYYIENRRRGKLVTHYISNNEYTDLQLSIPKDSILELTIYEASNDLLSNSQFSIPVRPEDNIPMPFILNDAILVTKTVRFE